MSKKISTGFSNLDLILEGGFESPSLVLFGSRPAMGKTAFCLSMINNIYKETQCSYESLSETENQILLKLKKINPNFSEKSVLKHRSEFKDNSILFIDYFQLMDLDFKNIYFDIWQKLNELKKLALDLNICIVLCTQLSRKVEERQDHRPTLLDLPDSNILEAHADQVLFLTRREYYDPMDKPTLAEIIVAKNRFGQTGSVYLRFDKENACFSNYIPIKNNVVSMYDEEFAKILDN